VKRKTKIQIVVTLVCFALSFSFCFAESKDSEKVLVKFKKVNLNLSKKNKEKKIEKFADKYDLKYLDEESTNLEKGQYVLFETENSNIIRKLQKDKKVESAQPNIKFKPAARISRDKYIARQWWIHNDGSMGTAGADIGAVGVWTQESKRWTPIAIGIIDSGANRKHKDTKKNIMTGYDFIKRRSKKMSDSDGHGSFMSGIIASRVSNKKGIAGMSRRNKLKVMPLKFDFTTAQAVEAVEYAKSRGVRVLNMSWGASAFDPALYIAIQNYPGIVVAAAGNDALSHDFYPYYPCDFDLDNIICVGASDANDRKASYSDWGSSVDLLAPGGEVHPIISTKNTGKNSYSASFGSSCSAAFVSGAVGMVFVRNPGITDAEVKNAIIQGSRKKSYLNNVVSSGGILDYWAAVERRVQ